VRIERENQTLATITFQNSPRMYAKLAGMTGTARLEPESSEGDRRERLVLALDAHAFLGLHAWSGRRPAAARHHAAGELVDDDDLAVVHDVIHVALVQACARSPCWKWCRIVMCCGS